MKGVLKIASLMLLCSMCCSKVPFTFSGCQDVKSPVCTTETTAAISFFPHETDCSLFYVCINGRLSTHKCPQGEYFFDKSKLCVNSSYVRCDRCLSNRARCGECGCGETTTPPPCATSSTTYKPITETVTPNEPTTERVTPNDSTTERVTPEIPTTERVTPFEPTTERFTTLMPCAEIPICSIFENGVKKPFPPDCEKYILCVAREGIQYILSCPPGLHFSPSQRQCMDASIANCPLCMVTPKFPVESTKIFKTLDLTTSTPPIPMCPPPSVCYSFEMGMSKPYPPDCNFYVYCTFNSAELRKCKAGFEFSPTLNTCVDAQISNCPLCKPKYDKKHN